MNRCSTPGPDTVHFCRYCINMKSPTAHSRFFTDWAGSVWCCRTVFNGSWEGLQVGKFSGFLFSISGFWEIYRARLHVMLSIAIVPSLSRCWQYELCESQIRCPWQNCFMLVIIYICTGSVEALFTKVHQGSKPNSAFVVVQCFILTTKRELKSWTVITTAICWQNCIIIVDLNF